MPSGAKQPLLGGDIEAGGAEAAVAARLEAGLEAGGPDGADDFEDLLHRAPDHVIEYIASRGTHQLGSFVTEDVEVLELIRDGGVWTMGRSSQDASDEDWRHFLEHDDYKAKGFPSKVEVEYHVVTIRNAALPDDRGLLNPILEKHQDGALSAKVFKLPAIEAVIQWKWTTWARRVLLWEFAIYTLWVMGFQAFVIFFQDEPLGQSLHHLWHTSRGAATMVSLALSGVGMLPFLYIEVCTLLEYGPMRWLNVWNLTDLATYFLQIYITVSYFTRWNLDSETISIFTALQVLLLYWKIQYWARAFQPLKNSFVDTLRAVIRDSSWFILLLLVTLWGFSAAFYILFRSEQGSEFTNPIKSLLTMLSVMLGGFDLGFFYKTKRVNPIVGITLLLIFVFIMSLTLLNSLIAIMSDAATKAADTDGTKFLCSKAQLIDELEASLPDWIRSDSWYPPYIHFLRVNPVSSKAVESMLWAATAGGAADEEEGGDDAGGVSDSGMAEQLSDLQKQVGRMEDLLRTLADRV
mmetsp:Transcript_6515/g.18757  ORF Transcript_6515/g.18757 Transcript_6515/m.18757 type:complete len:521 (-) Transcript_6515:416-1978(-)|eukprot:CAMPEP_0206144552 /NCGR_PEP_ID=MMETSP1473-20131121/24452_1 /ASSEMBLY_ACC=CAM_ASM_001109 /TAXON_ID=1461547 /ORGANISM="Stichococcus sp, Strain RCC1054" /LENGTH=520 /DNA_ID=CAMNT_0053540399 /DNA_START=63 /DNA_END=1625 /DNA_ORIENTATION=+